MSRSPVPLLLVSVVFYRAGRDEVPWLATIQAGTGGESSLPLSHGQTGAIHLHGLWSRILRRRKECWLVTGVTIENLRDPPEALMR